MQLSLVVFEAECESRYWSDLFLSFYLWLALKYYLCLPFSPSPLFPTDLMYLLLPLYTRFLLKRALGLFKQWDSTLKSSLWSSYLLHSHVFFLFIFLFSLLASPELYLLLFISKYSSWCSISDLNGKECISLGDMLSFVNLFYTCTISRHHSYIPEYTRS